MSAEPGTATTGGAAGEAKIEVPLDAEEAKRAARRVEKSAHRLVQDLAHLNEVLPSLGIKVTIETNPPSSG